MRHQPTHSSLNPETRTGQLRRRRLSRLALCSLITMSSGCGWIKRKLPPGKYDTKASYHDNHGLQIEYPEVAKCAETEPTVAAKSAIDPLSLEDPSQIPAFDLTLEEAIKIAVEQSPVLRSIGGTVVDAPQATPTIYDPSLTSASPVQGTEAALAAFDTQFTQQLFWNTNDQPNNLFFNPVVAQFQASVLEGTNATYTGDLSKQTAQGASFALRHVVNYTRNNIPSRAFSSAFDGWIEAEWRQPLMQGAGTTFNRIAGPNSLPGQYNGVLIARVNEDTALADFEDALVQLVSDVEQAYWDLVVAYRVLDATVKGREAAQQTFQFQQVRLEVGSGRSDEEAQARSQFYQFQAQVEATLGGTQGLYALEQRLRYLIGMPATDGRLIRPTTNPTDVKVVFDWESALGQALGRRVEIRRQMLQVRRREMELTAARLNLRPRLDFLAQYRWRGLGNHLIGSTTQGIIDPGTGLPNSGSNLYGNIASGDYQEAQAGFEMNFPVGLRTASVAVSHAKLNLRRERALLAETELRVSHDLSSAARQVALTHKLLETNYNRFVADIRQVDVLRRRYRDGNDNINFLLQAQRQAVTSATEFYVSLGNYNLAIRDFHREKGSLLAYNQVQLAEGPWAAGANYSAHQVGRFLTPRRHPEKTYVPAPVARGAFDPSAVQDTSGALGTAGGSMPTEVIEAVPSPAEPVAAPEADAAPDAIMPDAAKAPLIPPTPTPEIPELPAPK